MKNSTEGLRPLLVICKHIHLDQISTVGVEGGTDLFESIHVRQGLATAASVPFA